MEFLYGEAGYTVTNHQHNTEVRKKLKVFSLNIQTHAYGNNSLQHS